ncbi:MAG: hypothetical protein NC092_03210, partial [Butyrivibrio sp.]|nr:hypothetical protein [Butyrivibrio sp.]
PQYLYYYVYDVSENDLYRTETQELLPGMQLTEQFIPRYRYLTGVTIGAKRENSDNRLVGRLRNEQGRVIAESQFDLRDTDYTFTFDEWVKPEQQYQLEVLFPDDNPSPVTITFGPGDSAPNEHQMSYIGDTPSDDALYIRYIYGTYSRKLLAFWLIILFVGGFMIGETILSVVVRRNAEP